MVGTALAIGAGVTAAAASVGGTVAKVVGAANAASEASKQQGMALEAAAATPQELAQLERNMQTQERVLTREREMLKAIDPAIVEMGKQTLELIQGKEAAILDPLRRNRNRQRDQLRETLKRQLGPGFETSSAGIEALSRFDTESSDLLTQTQQNVTNQMIQQTMAARSQSLSAEAQANQLGASNLAAMGNIQARKVNAITGTAQGMVEGAGGIAKAIGSGFDSFANLAGTVAGAGRGFGSLGKLGQALKPPGATSATEGD